MLPQLRRRTFMTGTCAAALALPAAALGSVDSDENAAIIDTIDDTRPWLHGLRHDKNVRIVGRYYARDRQCGLAPTKRLTFNNDSLADDLRCPDPKKFSGGSEVEQLLSGGFGILSVYQFNSGDPRKLLFGLDDTGQAGSGGPQTDHIKFAEREADLDATAALDQAKQANQPAGTAIYFGLDFHLRRDDNAVVQRRSGGKEVDVTYSDAAQSKVRSRALKAASRAYFRKIRERIGGRYKVGLYGCGYASEYLRNPDLPGGALIEYTWISGSTSYDRTSAVLRSNDWHLFQNKLDRSWFTSNQDCAAGLDVDTNIQNPGKAEIGAWGITRSGSGELGPYLIPAARTQEIFKSRRPALRSTKIYNADLAPKSVTICRYRKPETEGSVLKTRSVRVLSVTRLRSGAVWLGVDIDEDGVLDGYCRDIDFATDLKAMPDYY